MSGLTLRDLKSRIRQAREQLNELTAERDRLREQRTALQEELGKRHGRKTMPRLRVEKTNGVPSFVVGQRMMQRVHARAENPAHGIDGAGAVFIDHGKTAEFVRSHGVPIAEVRGQSASRQVIVHAFKGQVGLVEVREDERVRHFDADQADPGDIRPSAEYAAELPVPDGFADMCAWSVTLSMHIPRPYVQIYWQETGDGPEVDHLDVDPDRIPVLTQEWDEKLGNVWDRAHARMLLQPFKAGALDNRVPGGTFKYQED